MKSFTHFLFYNNTVPIVLGVLFLGSGAAFAATNPDAIYSATTQVTSVDNTYIASKDLSNWSPTIVINGVTEDTDNYFVAYSFTTIDVVNYVWKDVQKMQTMTVSKADLSGRDLGVYVTSQFKNIIANEVAYLGQVQEKARKDITQQQVATVYSGLIGKFLNTTTETLPGYTPVLNPVPPPSGTGDVISNAPTTPTGAGSSGAGGSGGSTLLSLQLLGNNPAVIPVGTSYIDLGVVLIDPGAPNLGAYAFVDGKAQSVPFIDTSKPGVHTIEYRATDQAGTLVMVRRIVLVGDVADPGGEVSVAGNVQVSAPSSVVPGGSSPQPTGTPTTTVDTSTTTPAEPTPAPEEAAPPTTVNVSDEPAPPSETPPPTTDASSTTPQ